MPNYSLDVIISIYSRVDKKELLAAIYSVTKEQIIPPDKVIIVKDGDGCNEIQDYIIKNYNFNIPIVFVGYTKNKGPGYARDYGIRLSNADLIAIMDSDDISLANRFVIQKKEFEYNEELSLCGTYISEVDVNTLKIHSTRKVPLDLKNIKKCVKYKSPFNNISVMFKRYDYLKTGGYPPQRSSEDYYLWGKFIKNNLTMVNIPTSTAHVKFDTSSLHRRKGIYFLCDDIKTQNSLRLDKLISTPIFIRNIIIYSLFRLSPKWILTLIYKNILRK